MIICNKCGENKNEIEYYIKDKTTGRRNKICKQCCNNKQKEYYVKNKKRYEDYRKLHKNYFTAYQQLNSYKYKNTIKNYYVTHKLELQDKQRKYYYNNKEHVKTYNKLYKQNKRQNDVVYKFSQRISSYLRKSFNNKGCKKVSNLSDITGMSDIDLYNYLLSTFEKKYGYKYNNDVVHIDHIKPLASAKTVEDVMLLNHYSNLQLLTPYDNMKKWKN